MNPHRHALIVAACVVALASAGCGGAGSGSAGPSLAPRTAESVSASIVLHVPAPPTTTSASSAPSRRAQYVSIASRSVKVVIAPAAGCVTCSQPQTLEVALAGQSAPCVSNAQGRTCTIALSLNPGTYNASLIAYDGLLNAQGHVTGATLSENIAFPIAIASGQPNSTGVVLDGVPTTLAVTVLTPATLIVGTRIVNGHPTSIYRLLGSGATAQFSVTPKDADGNVIAGAGAPTWSAGATGGFTASSNANVVTLTAPAAFTKQPGALTVHASSTACTDAAAVCTLSVPVGFDQSIAVADTGAGDVSIWPIGGSAPSATITTGINGPYSVAFSSNGTLWVANNNSSTVTGYAPPYTGAPITISTGIKNPVAILIDAHDELIVANDGAANVTVYPPPYTTTTPVTLHSGNNPAALAFDTTQQLWILSSTGAVRSFPYPYQTAGLNVGIGTAASTFNQPQGIAVDSTGRVYVANAGNNDVLRFDPPYNQAPSATIASTVAEPMTMPSRVTVGLGDAVIVGSGDGVDAYSSAGTALGLTAGKFYKPRGFALDQDGTVWDASGSGNGPMGLPPPYDGTNPIQLTTNGFINPSAVAIYP